MEEKKENGTNWYIIGAFIVGLLSFAGIWIYALNEWGLLLGLIFGWIPAAIGGVILGIIWPIPVLIIGYLLFFSGR